MAYYGPENYEGCVEDAIDALNNKVFWVGLGRTTEWPNPNIPPERDLSITAIDEPIVYAIPQTISLCVPVAEGGDVEVGGQRYQFVDQADAYALFARCIYLNCKFDCDLNPELPYADWRQAAIFSNLVPVSGHENDQWLAPQHVQENGIIRRHVNVPRRTYGPGSPTTIEQVLIYR